MCNLLVDQAIKILSVFCTNKDKKDVNGKVK